MTDDLVQIENMMVDTVRRVFDHHLPPDHKISDAVLAEMCTAVCALITTCYKMGYQAGKTPT